MPTVNIYRASKDLEHRLKLLIPGLKKLLVTELSGDSIQLDTDEVSIRLIEANGDGMLAKVELEIQAAAFKERVSKQDEICLRVQAFLQDALKTDVKVWLILSELGHSWEEKT